MLQNIIALWCDFLGVTDPQAVSIASGVVAGGLALFVLYLVFGVVVMWPVARWAGK